MDPVRIDASSQPSVFFKEGYVPTPIQEKMAENLLNNILKPLLPLAGGFFTLTSGCRDLDDIARLKAEGYHPAANTDHFFGIPEPTSGAGDVIPAFGVPLVWDYIKAHCDRSLGNITLLDGSTISIGQCIHERAHSDWLHFSNPRRMFFPNAGGKTTLLESLDNGVTYKEV